MKVLRRNWMTLATVFSLVLLASVWWRASSLHAVVAIAPDYVPMSAVERDAVLKVLSDAALDTDALVALNLSTLQAESVLSTARTWQSNNAGTLTTHQATIDAAIADVRSQEKSIAAGPAQEGQDAALAAAVTSLVTAKADYSAALAPLQSSIAAVLSASQNITWTAIKTGHGQAMPLRMLALSDSQRIALEGQWQEFQCERTGSDAEAAATEWQADANEVLAVDQETVVTSYASTFAASSQVVSDAVALVLPLMG